VAGEQLAAAYFAEQNAVTARVRALLVARWRRVRRNDIQASWAKIAPSVTAVVTAGQYRAAELPGLYLPALLAEAGEADAPLAVANPGALSGVTAWGADMGSVLDVAPRVVLSRIGTGMPVPEAMRAGQDWLTLVANTEVADAGRMAMDVNTGLRDNIIGYVRMLNGASCARCAILAGRIYHKSQAFLRHPHCDCTHQPITRSEWDRHGVTPATDPKRYFRSLSDTDQDRVFGKAGAEAIRNGADPAQVVNVTGRASGLSAPGQPYTKEGAARRGVAGSRLQGAPRLTPQAILDRYGNDSLAYLWALKQYGYIL
jgi:hypothetical protein